MKCAQNVSVVGQLGEARAVVGAVGARVPFEVLERSGGWAQIRMHFAPLQLTPGTRLVRDWHGKGLTVVVVADGFEFDGKHWKSLTAIAKAITGAKWNGPRFFGLSERKA